MDKPDAWSMPRRTDRRNAPIGRVTVPFSAFHLTPNETKPYSTWMQDSLAEALRGFDEALDRLHESLSGDETVLETVFEGASEWTTLLRYKLVPHLAEEPYLIVAVAGGTNTGKSTVFNLLAGSDSSPVRATAAATCHPVVAANAGRATQCLEGRLIPEFTPRPLERAEDVLDHEAPEETLFVTEDRALPDELVLLDTPDVDSIDKVNWSVAENIRAAGDIIVAVLTGEKYKDEAVVAFFRAAVESGRIVLPLMNKADPDNDFETARRQLDEFREDTGVEGPCFLLPYDTTLKNTFRHEILACDGSPHLLAYLATLDTASVKEQVYKKTVQHFAVDAGHFLNHVENVADSLEGVIYEFEQRAQTYATQYDPAPGAAIGGLFHDYVQARRGPVRRFIGSTSTAVTKGAVKVGKTVTEAVMRRATLDTARKIETDDDVRALHSQSLEKISRDLARGYLESSQNVRQPAAHLLSKAMDELDVEEMVQAVIKQVIRSEHISDEFREYAKKMLDNWWSDHAGKRKVLEALDGVLAVMPAAIALPIAVHTGGYGVAETVAVTGPLAEQFLARVIEYQFGDALFDFITPWRKEQQQNFVAALNAQLTEPCLREVRRYLEPLQGEIVSDLQKWKMQCLTDSATS